MLLMPSVAGTIIAVLMYHSLVNIICRVATVLWRCMYALWDQKDLHIFVFMAEFKHSQVTE